MVYPLHSMYSTYVREINASALETFDKPVCMNHLSVDRSISVAILTMVMISIIFGAIILS